MQQQQTLELEDNVIAPEANIQNNLQKAIPIVPLKQWMLKYNDTIEKLGIGILHIDNLSPRDILLSKKCSNLNTSSNSYIRVYSLQDTHRMYIPDMPPRYLSLYRGNQFCVGLHTQDTFSDLDPSLSYYIRTYYHRSTTIIYSAIKLGDENNLLPFSKILVTERSTLDLTTPNFHYIGAKLTQKVDLDKYIDKLPLLKEDEHGIELYGNLITWLFDKYRSAYDINTRLIIDDILLDITTEN